MLSIATVEALVEARHGDPFAVLGPHEGDDGRAELRVFMPDARAVVALEAATGVEIARLERRHPAGVFNLWDGRRHPMRLRRECGVWELFLPGVASGNRYKFELRTPEGWLLPLKADPYGTAAELRPATASIVAPPPPPAAGDPEAR